MRAYLILQLRSLGAKYWVMPTCMSFAAMVLAVGAVALDVRVGSAWMDHLAWLHPSPPDGARALLSTIAGSTITVAGVIFSVTMVALATAASSFGPRLVGNFMQDRTNQIALGIFVATFLYCLMVLRTIRDPEDGEAFVPQIAVLGGLLFALGSLGMLIYFVHHVPENLDLSNIVARLGRNLGEKVDELYPEMIGDAAHASPADRSPPPSLDHVAAVRPPRAGYVQYVDGDGLMQRARHHDLFVRLVARPGDFVTAEDELARVEARARPTAEQLDAVRSAIVVGDYRSAQQDIGYATDRLVEVAVRALSPGINDVYTAMNAIDWLCAGLAALAQRRTPDGARRDEDGVIRVVTRPRCFEEVFDEANDRLRDHVGRDRNAARALFDGLHRVGLCAEDEPRSSCIRRQEEALREAARNALGSNR